MKNFTLHLCFLCTFCVGKLTLQANPIDSLHTANLRISQGELSTSSFAEGFVTTPSDSVQKYIDLARAVIEEAHKLPRFISDINESTTAKLPVILQRNIGGLIYEVVINSVRLKPGYAELDLFMVFESPQGTTLTFAGLGIKLTNTGAIVGDARLGLLGDRGINFSGDKIQLVLKGANPDGSGTFVNIDCDGFREMSLDAAVKFSRDLLVPENPDGSVSPELLVTDFHATLSNWNDLIVQVNLPSFQVATFPGWSFKALDVVFDFSDTRNAASVVFPNGYDDTQMLPGNENLWRGLFIRELSIQLPREFEKRDKKRTELQARNMLIDYRGVSGNFSAKDLISLNEGDMSGWAFSLDSLSVELMTNHLQYASLAGKIVIPTSTETPFSYSATISSDNAYLFTVAPCKNLNFDLWQARVDIYEGSSLEIKVVDGRFLPRATLHGKMDIGGESDASESGVTLANIEFENLQLQTVSPYLKVGSFSFGAEGATQALAKFPVSIRNVGLRNLSDKQTALDFDLLLNLVGENDGAFAADAGVSLITKLSTTESGHHQWKLDDVDVHSINVDVDGGAFKFKGALSFYKNDALYGNGFNGQVKAEFVPGIRVNCSAIFGNVAGNRYWYADALTGFDKGIPVFTGVGIYGFGGGAYFGVKMDNRGVGSSLGKTQSGTIYIPDRAAGLGLKAVILIGSYSKPEAFNGDVTFEIAFFKGGGVRRIGLMGNGYLVTPGIQINVDKLKATTNRMVAKAMEGASKISNSTVGQLIGEGNENDLEQIFGSLSSAGEKGQISAHVSIDYDFENRILHGTCEAFVNVAGGIIKGVGKGGRAGWAVLHFAPGEWYVYVGTPDDRIGLSVGIGPIRANATSYMMVGTKILGSPPPPANVSAILGGIDLDYMRDLNALGEGAGFAFGAAFGFDTGDLHFLMFYARFAAGAGFDIMLKDYGDAHCEGSGKRIGINGWYANGQAYAYVEGKIGIRVKVFGKKRSVKILEIGAAAVLQAKLPNPFWMQGTVGGRFSVLGGLVKGKCSFRMTIGNECHLVGEDDILDDVRVISEVTPADGSKEISVFNAPQGIFNMEVNKSFEIIDPDSNQPRYFRANLDHFIVLDGVRKIPASLEWNESHDVVALKSFDVLPPQKELKTSLQISFEEKVSGTWRQVVEDGKVYTENASTKFVTGTAPDFIPGNNVQYNYPVTNQLNFYSGETSEGYVQLKMGQPYLFEKNNLFEQKVKYTSSGSAPIFGKLSYSSSERKVNMDISQNLKPETIYNVEIVNVPLQEYKVDQNVTESATASAVNADVQTRSKRAEGQLDILTEKSIYSVYFRTSRFATFKEKIQNLPIVSTYRILSVPWNVHRLESFLSGPEFFDVYEIRGTDLTLNTPLIQLEAEFSSNLYYQREIYPLVYADYPIDGDVKITWRNTGLLGLPPSKAMYIDEDASGLLLTEAAIANGFAAPAVGRAALVFDLPYYMDKDFAEIQAIVVHRNIQREKVGERIHKILFSNFPPISAGSYTYKLKYVLPGINKATSEVEVTANY